MPDTALFIDDLISPRLEPLQRQLLDQLEAQSIDLDPEVLVAEAVARTGLEDFGPGDFRPRLNAYAAAIDAVDVGSVAA